MPALGHRIEVAPHRDRRRVGGHPLRHPPAGDVADGIDPDVEIRVRTPIEKPFASPTVGVGTREHSPAMARLGVERAESRVRFDIVPETVGVDVHRRLLWSLWVPQLV